MEPNSVAPITKMQTLAMAKFRFLNGCRSSSGILDVQRVEDEPGHQARCRGRS